MTIPKGFFYTVGVLAYFAAGFLTFGNHWNTECQPREVTLTPYHLGNCRLAAASTVIIWPVYWSAKLAIEVTR